MTTLPLGPSVVDLVIDSLVETLLGLVLDLAQVLENGMEQTLSVKVCKQLTVILNMIIIHLASNLHCVQISAIKSM